MRYLISSLSQMLRFPVICTLCQQKQTRKLAICEDCEALLQPIGYACEYCSIPLAERQFSVCGQCCKKKPAFNRVLTSFRYEEPLRSLIHQFKYQNSLYLAPFLAYLIRLGVPTTIDDIECLIPVPLHSKKLAERGYNQAAILARHLSRALNIPYHVSLVQKTRETKPQADLTAKQRQKNLINAYRVKPLNVQRVAIVDDILTTGSTAHELAKALKKQGVKHVDIWCCARACV